MNGTRCLNWIAGAVGKSHRSRDAIRGKAMRMGVGVSRPICGRKDTWNDGEIEAIKEHYPKGGAVACLPYVGKSRSKNAIKAKALEMGVLYTAKYFTAEDDAIIRKYYRKEGIVGCQKRLVGRGKDGIRYRAKIMGLKYDYHAWTKREDKIIHELYPSGGSVAVHEQLPKRTRGAITARAADIGVKYKR